MNGRVLDRWRLRRRWGPRSTWTGNNVHDVAITQLRNRLWIGTGWSICRCGKEIPVRWSDSSEVLARKMAGLGGELCQACKAWCDKRSNRCPEGDCTLTYEHKGRCEPFEVTDELREAMRARRAEREASQDGPV